MQFFFETREEDLDFSPGEQTSSGGAMREREEESYTHVLEAASLLKFAVSTIRRDFASGNLLGLGWVQAHVEPRGYLGRVLALGFSLRLARLLWLLVV